MAVELKQKIVVVADMVMPHSGNIYKRDTLIEVIKDVSNREVYGTFVGVNSGYDFDMSKVAIRCYNFALIGDALVCDFTIMDTPYGATLSSLLEYHQMKLTPTGYGDLHEDMTITNYNLLSVDVMMQ